MSLRKDIEETLYKHVTSFTAVSYEDATDAILEVLKSSIPEKKHITDLPDFPEGRLFAEAFTKGMTMGYNLCRKEVLSILGEDNG